MKLDKLKQNKGQSANYMFDFISHVTSAFGKRDCGSQGEKDAINYMANEAAPYADTVTTEKYDVHTLAFMGWIYITVTLILGAFAAAFFMPMLSLILIAVGMEIMILEFVLYRKVVDKLFPKRESLNMMAIKNRRAKSNAEFSSADTRTRRTNGLSTTISAEKRLSRTSSSR